MQFGVLGPLLVQDAQGPVVVSSPMRRALLAVLLLESPHKLVPVERLIDELWGDDPPSRADKGLQVHVSKLRRSLGAEQPTITRPGGYALEIDPGALDLHRFDTLVSEARRLRAGGELESALSRLQDAWGLW
jgi:DNA-binding SARP family transcriptional activator